MRRVLSAFYLFAIRAIAVMVQLKLLQRWFGPSYAGLNAILNQITFYILLAELGLASAGTSLLFEPILAGDQARSSALVLAIRQDCNRIIWWIAALGSVFLTLFCLHLRSDIPFSVLWISSMFCGAGALLTLASLPYQCFLNGADKLPIRNFILGTGFLLKTLIGLALARVTGHFYMALVSMPLVSIGEFYAQRFATHQHLPSGPVTKVELTQARKDLRGRAKFVLFHRVGGLVYFQSDYVILTFSASLALISRYAQYQYLVSGLLSLFAALSGTFLARVARHRLQIGERKQTRFYFQSAGLLASFSAFCATGFFLLSPTMVHLIYGGGGLPRLTVALMTVLLMLNLFKSNDDLWIDSSGVYSVAYYLPLMEASFYLVSGFVLMRLGHLQINGLLIAGIATNLLFTIGFKCYIVSRGILKASISRVLLIKVGTLGAAALLMLLVIIGILHSAATSRLLRL